MVAALAAGFVQTGSALVDAGAATATGGPAEKALEAATAEATTIAKPANEKMTVEQVRAAIAAAEKERLAKTRPDPELSKVLREQWGVEVIGINRTSAGYMLDFRFRVVDAEKALPLFEHRIKPYVLTDRAHIKLPVPMAPKVGAFRPTNRGKNIKADKTYYMVFANPDSFVKPGEKVSVVIGDFRAENLTVH
jgi:hypothetical protein